MADLKRNKVNKFNINCLELAFQQARINLGSTKTNPSVGCVVEKNGSIISTGTTSINGRPHAEHKALNQKKILKIAHYMSLWNLVIILVIHPLCKLNYKKEDQKSILFYRRF